MRKSNDKLRILLKRSLVMFSVNIFLLFVLVGRLYYLQVYQGENTRFWPTATAFLPVFWFRRAAA